MDDPQLPNERGRRDSALRSVLEGLPDAVVATSRDGRIDFVNARAAELFGYSREELLGQPVALLWAEPVRDLYTRNLRALFETGGSLRFAREAHGRRKDGSEFVGEMSWGLVDTAEGPLMLAVGRDISERLATEARLRRRSAENAVVAMLGERAIAGGDPGELAPKIVEAVGETLEADLTVLFELAGEDLELRPLAVWADPAESADATLATPMRHAEAALKSGEVLTRVDDAGGFQSGLAVAVRSSEERFGVLCAYSRETALDQEDGAFLRAVANVLAGAINRRRMDERMQHQALHDPLTGLANRTLCHDRLAQALARSGRSGAPVGVFFVDLDRFKKVNDNYGHAAGDAVLAGVARRLEEAVRPADTVGRFGGDEFLVICEDLDERQAVAMRKRLAAAASVPVEAAGATHRLSASIGFALGEGDVRSPDALIREADKAVYRAKQSGVRR